MVVIHGKKYETYPIKRYKFKGLCSTIVAEDIDKSFCPVCGRPLSNYTYAVKINEKECIPLHGNACLRCDMFFYSNLELLFGLEKLALEKQYDVIPGTFLSHDISRFEKLFMETKSAYKQYVLSSGWQEITITFVNDWKDRNKERHFFFCKSKLEERIESCFSEKRTMRFNGIDYEIKEVKEKPKPKSFFDYYDNCEEDFFEFETVTSIEIRNPKDIDYGAIPSLTNQHTVHIYNGFLKCHKEHTVVEFLARILSLGEERLFRIEYCYEEDKFMMNYSIYEAYLKKYGFYPFRKSMAKTYSSYYGFADYSPLYEQGYNANLEDNYSDEYRQEMLKEIVEKGIMSKQLVVDYLTQFINVNGKSEKNYWAKTKWEADREYVFNKLGEPQGIVTLAKLERI